MNTPMTIAQFEREMNAALEELHRGLAAATKLYHARLVAIKSEPSLALLPLEQVLLVIAKVDERSKVLAKQGLAA